MSLYIAIKPDGTNYSVQNARKYTHAVATFNPFTAYWAVTNHCGSLNLAQRRLATLNKNQSALKAGYKFEILELQVTD